MKFIYIECFYPIETSVVSNISWHTSLEHRLVTKQKNHHERLHQPHRPHQTHLPHLAYQGCVCLLLRDLQDLRNEDEHGAQAQRERQRASPVDRKLAFWVPCATDASCAPTRTTTRTSKEAEKKYVLRRRSQLMIKRLIY